MTLIGTITNHQHENRYQQAPIAIQQRSMCGSAAAKG